MFTPPDPKSPLFDMVRGIVNAQAALVRWLPAEPRVTRIEFAPGHEDARLTSEQVAALMRKVRLAPRMLAALRDIVAQLEEHDDRYREPECPLCAAVSDAKALIAEAEGRS
jgi:hypothetical protein